jgi:hypothetical protein
MEITGNDREIVGEAFAVGSSLTVGIGEIEPDEICEGIIVFIDFP